ncbi:MAG: response regulator [Anaerolineae bacterium]|nr:response regulator [Anaerolineae bacterium]
MPPLETIIIIGALIGLLLLLLVGAVAFLGWRRRIKKQAAKKKQAARKQQVKKRQVKPTASPAGKVAQSSPAKPETPTPADPPPASAPAIPAAGRTVPGRQPEAGASPPASVIGPTPASAPASPKPIAASPTGTSDERIRILVVDDNPDTRENVSRLLYFENDIEVIGQAHNGRQGIEMAIELKPHIVLMDINMPDMDGITATERMSVESPYSQVIIMSVQAEQHYMKRAMAAGARDFQPKPFTSDELISCVRRVYGIGKPIYQKIEAAATAQAQLAARPKSKLAQSEASTPVIAVFSPKGGIGVSAIAANLAVALQQMQGDVVLMDGDLQFGDISVHLNVRPTRTISDIVHDGELDIELLSEVVLPHHSGLKLLLAPPEPQLADTILPDMLPEVVKGLKNLFKAVVVDTCSQLTDITVNILEKADYILVITSPELPAIKSVKLFLELAGRLEFAPNRLSVVINRAQIPGGVRPDQIGKVLKLSQQPYLVPYDPRIYMAMYKGALVNQQDSSAPSAQAIARLAAEVWQKLAVTEEETLPVVEMA